MNEAGLTSATPALPAPTTAALALADALRRQGLWLDASRYAHRLQCRRNLGHRLMAEPAARTLPSWQVIVERSGYGRSSRASVSLNLVYGYQMVGVILADGSPPPHHGRAGLAACFNLVASLFDRVCDNPDLGRPTLLAVMDEAILERVLNEPARRPELLRHYETSSSPTVRLLLLAMFAFFDGFECLREQVEPARHASLTRMLIEAYRAQLLTPDLTIEGANGGLLLHTRHTAVLTLRIIGQLALLAVEPSLGAMAVAEIEDTATTLGHLFSLIDDIVDLAKDERLGDANALLFMARAEHKPPSTYVKPAIDTACATLAALLGGSKPYPDSRAENLLFWVRCWVGYDGSSS